MAAKNGVINLAKFLGKSACPEASYMQAAVQYSTGGGVAAYKLPELPYSYSALGGLSLRIFLSLQAWLNHIDSSAAALQPSCATNSTILSCQHTDMIFCPAEPVISGQIMELHHAKHHATYVANLNKALEQYAEAESKQDLQKMISLQSAINFNGGGVLTACMACASAGL
jgi:superoxide dismutase